MSSFDLIAACRDEDSDTFSVDSLEVNTPKDTKDFLKTPSEQTYPIRDLECTERRAGKAQEKKSHTSKISVTNALKEAEDRLAKRSERYPVNGRVCTSERLSKKSHRVNEKGPTGKKPVKNIIEAFKDDKDKLVKHYGTQPSVISHACTSHLVSTQSNGTQETCHTSTIPETKMVEAFSVNKTDEDKMTSPVMCPIDSRECVEEWLCTQPSTVGLQERRLTSNRPSRNTTTEAFYINDSLDSQLETVETFPVDGSTSTLEWVFSQSKTVQETRRTIGTVPEGNRVETFSTTETQDNQTKSFEKYPVTVLECTSEGVCTLSNKTGQGFEQTRHTEETFNKIQIPNKTGTKKTKQLEVPFYNRKVAVSEVKKIQKLNRSVDESSKKKSVRVLTGEVAKERTSRVHAPSNGVVERWRHNVKPIYEHSTLAVQLANGRPKNKCNRSTISHAISKMKIDESNSISRRASKSVCGVARSSSPGARRNAQLQKPAPNSKRLPPNGYTRNKTPSYLEQYRMEKYGPIYVKRKPPSDGTECSLFDGSTVASLSSELKDKPVNFSSPESSGDEWSFYRKIISGEVNPSKGDGGDGEEDRTYRNRLSDEYDNLRSVSQVNVNANRVGSPGQKTNYVPYSLEDYRTMIQPTRLGRLGPDVEANKEKFEKLRKHREYGDMASLKNIHKMQFQKRKFQTQLQLQPDAPDSAQAYTNRFSEDDFNNSFSSTSHQHELCSNVTSPSANCASIPSPATQESSMKTTTKTKKKKKTATKAKREEEQQTFASNKSLIKILQERHKRELEMTEKLRKENMK